GILLSPRLAALVACGSSAASRLEHHSALASPLSSPAAPRQRLGSNIIQPSPRRSRRLRLLGSVSARTSFSPRLAADSLSPRLRASPFSSKCHASGINSTLSSIDSALASPLIHSALASGLALQLELQVWQRPRPRCE